MHTCQILGGGGRTPLPPPLNPPMIPIKYLSWPDLATCPKYISSGHTVHGTYNIVLRWAHDRIKKRREFVASQSCYCRGLS